MASSLKKVKEKDDAEGQSSKLVKSSSTTSLTFPRPHQLGLSTGIHLSRSSRTNLALQPFLIASGHSSSLERVPYHGGSCSDSAHLGEDQPDYAYGPPPPKKAATMGHLKPRIIHGSLKPVVKTYNDSPLLELALFLPPRLPRSILQSQTALAEFVISTSVTYLSLWEVACELQVLNLRFPTQYVEKLSDDTQFLATFVANVFEQVRTVKSIKELLLPKAVLHRKTDLTQILQPIVDSKCFILHLYLPVMSSLKSHDLTCFDLKAIASSLRRGKVENVTFISTDGIVKEFSEKISTEVKRSKKNSVSVSYSDRELGVPGPNYIAELDGDTVTGEIVDPLSLVTSLNVTSESCESKCISGSLQKSVKKRAHGAFSTDCTYADEAELSSEGPFVSEIWNLERLHEEGINGMGTTIAVIDSGINYMHPAFKGKIVAIKNFVKEEIDDIDCAIDSDGHGTHCAGIAAGSSHFCPVNTHDPNAHCIRIPPGVAPGSKLVICKVVKTSNGEVDSDAFFASLDWLKNQHLAGVQKIDVVSISLASTYYSHERAQVISDLTSLGVIVVCCASNVGRLRLQPIAFPARLGHVLCIGAHDENGKPTSFSPVGRELDFLSPGDNLWGPGPGTVGPFAMDCASGTSCATPAVAGLVCLILQAVTEICESDPDEFQIGGKPLIDHIHNVWVMREILKEMSSSPGHHSEEIGYGTLNPYRIIDRSNEEIKRLINEIIEDE